MAEKMDILIDKDDGKMRMVRLAPGAILDSDVVPADHPTRKAMEVGLGMFNLLPDDRVFSGEFARPYYDPRLGVIWATNKVPPPEPVGVEWLKSLPVGTRVLSPGGGKMFIAEDGIMWSSGVYHQWDTMTSWAWMKDCCPETCPEWTPEENNDADKYPENRPCL